MKQKASYFRRNKRCIYGFYLTNVTTEKGNVELVANVCPLKLFVAESYYSK